MRERKLNRLPGYDYSSPGAYFITICCHTRNQSILGRVINGEMVLNPWGKIVFRQWEWIGIHFIRIRLDEWVIMPDHVHGIIIIPDNVGYDNVGYDNVGYDNVGAGHDLPPRINTINTTQSIPHIIGAFKTTSSKLIHQSGFPGFKWQRSYYDRIIRDNRALMVIRNYIRNNPRNYYR